MNLSSYLQMPPAPLMPTNTNHAVPQGARTGVGPAAGGGLGFDFAQVMARQMERLVPQERQTFAADVPEHPPVNDDTQDSRPAQEHHSTQRAGRETQRDAHTNSDASSEDADAPSQTRASPRSKPAVKANRSDVDALLEGLMQGAPVAPIAPAAVLTPVAAATTVANPDTTNARASTLQTVELSPQMRIITDPQKAPSPESLAAFAKSMGLDESAIQDLLAQQPATQASPLTGGASTDLTAGMPAPNAGMTLPTTMGASLNGALLGSAAGTPADSAVATQLAAMAASSAPQAAAAVSGAGLAAAATTLTPPTMPGLTPTDMAAIQQLQITVLPAAVLPVNTAAINTPTPSTIDMLSLLGTGVDEQDVSALLSRFTEDAGSESGSEQPASQGDGNNFSSFAQTLSRSNNAATTSAANAAPTAANMSEVYDQLSDKMATEMAARMHKQLSDGEWKMKFALRPSNLGGVEIQLEMKDGKLDAVFRADNPLTRDLLQNSSQRLREALGNFGINAGQVNVGQGGGNSPHSNSGNSGKNSQVRDNSSSQVNGSSSTSSATATRNKANASLLDLYA
jgi:flagellar hook-length control protein FliK